VGEDRGEAARVTLRYGRADALGPQHRTLSGEPRTLKQTDQHLFQRAVASLQAGKLVEAERDLFKFLRRNPQHFPALNLYAVVLMRSNKFGDAESVLRQAIAINERSETTFYNFGIVLTVLARPAEALEAFSKAIAINPSVADAWCNRGSALNALNRFSDAVQDFDRAIALNPNFADAHYNRGNSLRNLKRYDDAGLSYQKSLSLNPNNAAAWLGLGYCLSSNGRYQEAANCFARTLSLVPEYAHVKGYLLHHMMLICDWDRFDALKKSIDEDLRAGKPSADPFGYQAVSESPADLRRSSELWAALYNPASATHVWNGERYGNPRIRLGYVSGEFREQATSRLMAELFELHDKSKFELFAFDNGWDDGTALRQRVARSFEHIIDVSQMTDIEAARCIAGKRIDILVNLNGYFGLERARIFSHRPAPIQVNYLGFPGTMGVDYMDYIIADRCVIPTEHFEHYTVPRPVLWTQV
jgi:predicted O-linked N-acetylglucosamine transferase (SPINDLY family)